AGALQRKLSRAAELASSLRAFRAFDRLHLRVELLEIFADGFEHATQTRYAAVVRRGGDEMCAVEGAGEQRAVACVPAPRAFHSFVLELHQPELVLLARAHLLRR